ncbi:ABC transporter permease subunit [Methylophaga muralis]|uniref:Phosphate transport system permease protein PstC n=1 Tax=Methylophaga muralis TaxID=291169 RepID=A0A1E3GVS9_9GAMM|nr:ABC transporter permease subunit [Methylophaga muralis]ODN68160.1 Phosphate transport system permease protein PstC [Methylophaga muralis]
MNETTLSADVNSRGKSLLPSVEAREKMRKKRDFKDKLSRWGITYAGYGVVFALAMIFVYLFYEVMPILKGASVTPQSSYSLPVTSAQTQHLILERYEELGIQYTDDGVITFFEADDGEIREQVELSLPDDASITSFAHSEYIGGVTARGLSNGQVHITKHSFQTSFPNDQRLITPVIDYPFGEAAITIDEQGQPLELLAIETVTRGSGGSMIAALTADKRLLLTQISSKSNLLTGEVTVENNTIELSDVPASPVKMLLDKALRSLFITDSEGFIHYYSINDFKNSRLVATVNAGEGSPITAIDFLVGSVSLIAGNERGELSQWFLVRDENNNYDLTKIREFKSHKNAITALAPEYTRKGFLAVDAGGYLGIHYGTSARTLYLEQETENPLVSAAISQVNGRLLLLDDQQQVQVAGLWNQHPQLSFSAMWNKVWYEGRADPEYIWQSSSASDEFESKFSLVPLSIGTLKAALYAMLFAMPLAIAGAIYTAYFMSPKIRGVVKPSIEIMEALPTVILGFLAGLWLAPFAEDHLPAIFSFVILMPVMMLLFAFIWTKLPAGIRHAVPDGWEAALLVPVILLFGYICITASPYIEIWFFNGSMRQWFTDVGITYDQRNAMIVGIAMGFAVIPTIFSIAEDAVFTVPKHLTQGSLALGATRWQTVVGVVLPTASPGIFSAIMMGFGRAVGETMIVLMATGNSPVVNFNIFEGMRTLSANIAVELPETAVGSSHFRILFLAALVLLALTFIVNTFAEIIRQRLRARYSNL